MAQTPEEQLKGIGSKLETPPPSKDALLKLLKQAATCLSELEQAPPTPVLTSMQPFLDGVVKPEILKHQDKDVKLLVASCVCEITRITAPEAPYSDDVMKDIFHLIVSTFSGLSDMDGPSFGRRVVILETVAKYRSCVVMLDLECDDLVYELFATFFAVARDDQPENVLASMRTIMNVLLEENEDIREDILLLILSKLGRNRTEITAAARSLALKVIEQCAEKVEADIKKYIISSMSGDSRLSSCKIEYHEVIYDVFRCAPQILSGVTPYLTGELLTDQLDTRLKAVRLVGDLFSLRGASISEEFRPIFSEFLKRLTDRAVEVRMLVLEYLKGYLLSDISRVEAPQIISALCDRLLDYDENIRKQVVEVICDVASHALPSVSMETIKLVAERLRDKAILVKKFALERLVDLFRIYCLSCVDSKVNSNDLDWIPGKILRCFYDKDFRSDTIESVLCSSLFPSDFSVKDKVKLWIRVFSGFDKVELKALEKILEQKQRLQQEMRKYLSLRQMKQGADAPEIKKKIVFCFRVMSRAFSDPVKAEEDFHILDQLKDVNIWKIMTNLLDTNTSVKQTSNIRDDLLKILGEKHRLYDFLGTLSLKCSYMLFNKEHVTEILAEVYARTSAGSSKDIESVMNLLVTLACFCPLLFAGSEEELINLLKDENEIIKEGALHILAKAGGTIREHLNVQSSSIDLLLERICVEGTRRQAKYAVHALAAITKDDGLKSLSVLYKRLVDMLEEKTHLPAVLQCLGCIAQIAMPVFETRESEIVEFIKTKILKCENESVDNKNSSWDSKSELCQVKTYGIKTLVKSFLPVNDSHLRVGVDSLIEMLKDMLSFGEVSEDIGSSSVDKAHLRLAAAKAVLRLSRHWDHKIPVIVFHLIVTFPKISFPQAKRKFLGKVHQYIKDRLLDTKFACSFLFDITGSKLLDSEEEKQNLADIVHISQQTKARQISGQSEANPVTAYPEYILPYLVHVLGHQSCPDIDKSKDVKEYEMIYRQLYLFVTMLLHKEEDEKSEASNKEQETLSTIISIFQSIKHSEDVVDATKSKNSHAICELGLSITKRLAQKEFDLQGVSASVSLPTILYKSDWEKEGDDSTASEVKMWLANETIIAHFESLDLETKASANSVAAEDKDLMDPGSDGNELPLGKIVQILKGQTTKIRKGKKKTTILVEAENGQNDVDILKMVREINFDNLGVSNNFESSNGHEHSPSKKLKMDLDDHEVRKRKVSDATSGPVPKRQRSSSTHGSFKFSKGDSKVALKVSKVDPCQEKEMDEGFSWDAKDKSREPELAVESSTSSQKGKSFLSKRKNKEFEWGSSDEEFESEGTVEDNKKQKQLAETVSTKKKRKSISGLAKCSIVDCPKPADDLIGYRIKVWWPLDKEFYEGTVKSYDPIKNKHVILYADGDIEVLRLDKERWEHVDKGRKATKKLISPKGSPYKKQFSGNKNNSLGGSRERNNKVTTPKGKRTPKKYLNRASAGNHVEDEKKENADNKDPKSATAHDTQEEGPENEDNKLDNEESEREVKSASEDGCSKDKMEYELEDEKLISEEMPCEEDEAAQKTEDEKHGSENEEAESNKSSSHGETEGDDSDSNKKQGSKDVNANNETDVGEDEMSDNEILGVWKRKFGKTSTKRAT